MVDSEDENIGYEAHGPRTMNVDVHRPMVGGETVVFGWDQSEPNPFQFTNSFFYRYDGIDLTSFSMPLFYEIFLGLQLKIFAAYDHPVVVNVPEPVSASSVSFWKLFHHADNVEVSPLDEPGDFSPWSSGEQRRHNRPWGALFGGGKDSTLATCLLRELYGAENMVLFQTVVPLRPPQKLARTHALRQEALMLQPAREHLGVATQMTRTDFVAQQFKSRGKYKPLLETYTVGMLPAFLTWGITFLTVSLPWSAFPFVPQPNGRTSFRWSDVRPEMLATQGAHYQQTFGMDLTLTNLNLLFTTFSAYRMLSERYPDPFTRIVMCVAADHDERWCYDCSKCAEYALFSLANGIVDPRFDYDRLFSDSRYVHRLLGYIESGVEHSTYGNLPWQPFFGTGSTNFTVDCHAIALVDPGLIAYRLNSDGFDNLLMLKASFGNRLFPYAEQIPADVITLLNHETARRAAAIAAEHLQVVDRLHGPFLSGNDPVNYDFSVRMTIDKGYGR